MEVLKTRMLVGMQTVKTAPGISDENEDSPGNWTLLAKNLSTCCPYPKTVCFLISPPKKASNCRKLWLCQQVSSQQRKDLVLVSTL